MSEQQSQTTATTVVQVAQTSACPHPEAVGTRWGDPISAERQAELQGYLDRYQAEENHGKRKGPFDGGPDKDGFQLTGADVFWLAGLLAEEPVVRRAPGSLKNLHLEGADFSYAHLEGANFYYANLEGANFLYAHLEGAKFPQAQLQGAVFLDAYLMEAQFYQANMRGASLQKAHLEGADFDETHLERASLREALLNSKTQFTNVTFDMRTALGDIQWGGIGSVNLTRINWDLVPTLGDEYYQRIVDLGDIHGLERRARLRRYEDATRAYRQLAIQLRAQGMNNVADRFAYRAQVLQRRIYLRRFRIPQYLGSLFLDPISGYGYRPMRSFITYVLVILGFAATYFALGGANGQALSWNEAVVVSMTAFHGRGFFAAVFQPGDLQAAVAAVEAFIGLLIEIVFIATFTQRFFAR